MPTPRGRESNQAIARCASFVSIVTAFFASLVLPGLLRAQKNGPEPWTDAEVVKPKELVHQLSSSNGAKPVVICAGFRNLYSTAHIPSALYAGPARQADGLAGLRQAVEKLPKTREIVLYCGCCPFAECPNVRPAFQALHKMGFTQVKVLYLENNFGQDWVAKGYPIEKGIGKGK